jgi:hypothetical protein
VDLSHPISTSARSYGCANGLGIWQGLRSPPNQWQAGGFERVIFTGVGAATVGTIMGGIVKFNG